MTDEFSYEIAYPRFTFPLTHPDHLAVIAALNGMAPIDPSNCRVLELGCGSGANLLSFAYTLPNSEFTGIDLLPVHIEEAQQAADELNVTNCRFFQEDILDFDFERFGTFDIIIAHGLFSWVPQNVREKILQIYAECLASNGVGYISYNAYPGCHIRKIVREAMQYHAAGIENPMEKAHRAVEFLAFLEKAADPESLHHSLIAHELNQTLHRLPANVIHDDLWEFNEPFYFHEFASMLSPKGLQFLSETDPSLMLSGGLPPIAQQQLEVLGTDIIKREQYFDLIIGRRFRATLVCRDGVAIERNPSPDILKNFLIATNARQEVVGGNGAARESNRFTGPNGAVEIGDPMTKAALVRLGKLGARAMKFDDLISALQGASDATDEIDETAKNLLDMYRAGFVKLHLRTPTFADEPGEFPRSSEFARWQLRNGSQEITTLTGENVKANDDFLTRLIMTADGTRNRADITLEMREHVEVEESQKASFEQVLPVMIEGGLKKLAESALLLPEFL